MKTILSPVNKTVPTLIIALSDKLKAELMASLEDRKLFKVINILIDGEQIFEILEIQKPDFLLIDTELPNAGGYGFLKKLSRIRPQTKVIIYSKLTTPDYLKVFLSSPASGFIQQGCGIDEFVTSLQSIFSGNRLIFSQINEPQNKYTGIKKSVYDLSTLTEREMDVWELLMEAKTEKEIAEILFIGTSTVRTHKNKIAEKLDIKGKKKLSTVALFNN
ncbi:MAG: response regulator transcription factor [Bacteroidota bacterium]